VAVYTALDAGDIDVFLTQYDIGELVAFQGIAEGVENSNFLIETTQGKFILTLFEKRVSERELPYCIGLMEHLSKRGVNCPRPVYDHRGNQLNKLKNKPALIVTFIVGHGLDVLNLNGQVNALLGAFCATMQVTAKDFCPPRGYNRANTLSLAGWQMLAEDIGERAEDIEPGLTSLIAQEITYLKEHWPQGLPHGPIHADLFPDNVFFVEDRNENKDTELTGVIDLYFACDDMWMYDFAICANAWTFNAQYGFILENALPLLLAYKNTRASKGEPVNAAEIEALTVLCRGAALRFLLTRTYDWLNHPPGAQVTRKNPKEYIVKLRYWQHYGFPLL
jgi:homoserine kinase type II